MCGLKQAKSDIKTYLKEKYPSASVEFLQEYEMASERAACWNEYGYIEWTPNEKEYEAMFMEGECENEQVCEQEQQS